MRKLKFRVWDGDQQCFICPVCINEDGLAFRHENGFNIVFTEPPQRYTGLKDCNGKEIYEGDIIARQPFDEIFIELEEAIDYYFIEYNDKTFNGNLQFHPMTVVDECYNKYYGDWHNSTDWKVVGNVYETLELLKENN